MKINIIYVNYVYGMIYMLMGMSLTDSSFNLMPYKLLVSVFSCRFPATLRVFRFYSLIFVKYRGHNKCLRQQQYRGCGGCPVMNNTTASPKIGKQNRVVSHRGTLEHLPLSIEL